MKKRLEADALELPFEVDKHVKTLLVLLSPSCQSNTLEIVQQIYRVAEDPTGLNALALVGKDGSPSVSEVISATFERMLGISNRIASMGGVDDQVNSVLEGLHKAAAEPKFEVWRTSDLLRLLMDISSDIINIDHARRVTFDRAVDIFPREDSILQSFLKNQLDSSMPLPPSMISRVHRFLHKLSDPDLVKLFGKTKVPTTNYFVPILLERLDAGKFNVVTDVLNCVTPTDVEEKYTCLPIAQANGDMHKVITWAAEIIQNLSSPHPFWRLRDEYPFLVAVVGAEDPDVAANALVNASPEVKKLYGVEYVMDALWGMDETIEQLQDLPNGFDLLTKVAERYTLRGIYIKLRDAPPIKQLDVVSELFNKQLLKANHDSFFKTHPRFTEKIFQLIISASNAISTNTRWLKRVSRVNSDLRLEVRFSGHFASRAPHANLISLGDESFQMQNMPVLLPLQLKSMKGEHPAVVITRTTKQKLSKLASITPPGATHFPKAFTEKLANKLRTQIDSPHLARLLDFEIVRNPTTISEGRLEAIRRLITTDLQELAQLTGEPRPLSWLGDRAGQIAYQDIFRDSDAYELLESLESLRESHPGYYRYWSGFLARGLAEYYASGELQLEKQFRASGMQSKQSFEELPENALLLGHRRVLMKNYGRGAVFMARVGPKNIGDDTRATGTLDCQIVNELNKLWHGFCNVPFALLCTQGKRLEAASKLEQASILIRDDDSTMSKEARKAQAEALRREAQKLTAEQMAIWRSVFIHITEDGIAKAFEAVPQEFFLAFDGIPIPSAVWKHVAEAVNKITSLDPEVLAERKKSIFRFATTRATDVTPWLAVVGLEINYPQTKIEAKKLIISIAGKFAEPVSDPLNPHEGIKRIRELIFKEFDPSRKMPAAPYSWKQIIKTPSSDMAPVLSSIALRVFEALPEAEMKNMMSAQPITLLMSAQVKNATKMHWDKFLSYFKYKPLNMKPALEKLDTTDAWSKFFSVTSLEDEEIVIKLTSSGLPSIVHLCTELSTRLNSPEHKPTCSSASKFFQLVRLIAAVDAEGTGFEKCLEVKYKAFSSLGRVCNVFAHPSEDPLEALRHLQFERPNEQMVTETIIPVNGFWPPRVIRTLYAALFSLYENREFAATKSYHEIKASLMGPEKISFVRGLLGAANRNTLDEANRFARLQWHQHRLRYVDEDLSLWRFASVCPFFGVRFVPMAPAVHRNYQIQLLLVEASNLLVQELEVETRAYDKRMNICELKALSVVEGSEPPPYDRTFVDSMRRRYDKMIQHIENNDYRDILYLARKYNKEAETEVSAKLLAGPGRLRNIISRYGRPDELKKIVAWMANEMANEPFLTDEQRVELLRRAFLSRGFNLEIRKRAQHDYSDVFGTPGLPNSPGPGTIPPLPGGGPPPLPGGGPPLPLPPS